MQVALTSGFFTGKTDGNAQATWCYVRWCQVRSGCGVLGALPVTRLWAGESYALPLLSQVLCQTQRVVQLLVKAHME